MKIDGGLFYTLPLRLQSITRLPVHFNAGWLVRADRRDIERPKDSGEVATWHTHLMSQLLAPAYARALVQLTREEAWWASAAAGGPGVLFFATYLQQTTT